MKGRESKGPLSADLLVCFPARAHLTQMPKRICSPAPPSKPSTSHHQYHHRPCRHLPHHHHHLRKSSTSRGHAGPILWAKANKPNNSDISEPTSPKVTCAGQIKVRPRPNSCKSWRSVMQEIERLHGSQSKQKKKPAWIEAMGFKKDAIQFPTCLRNFRFDFRCFGSFPAVGISSDDDDGDEDDEDDEDGDEEDGENPSAHIQLPPPNAMLLMRCRSAPAKSWLEEKLEENEGEKEGRKHRLTVMRCGAEFSKLSADIAKETWVVGGIKDMLSRSRSSKR
ncbi:hypothetical protein OROGR_016344 [Orobanche gracilis]